jgi:hypothetical protein
MVIKGMTTIVLPRDLGSVNLFPSRVVDARWTVLDGLSCGPHHVTEEVLCFIGVNSETNMITSLNHFQER